jgi:hypothetical protein
MTDGQARWTAPGRLRWAAAVAVLLAFVLGGVWLAVGPDRAASGPAAATARTEDAAPSAPASLLEMPPVVSDGASADPTGSPGEAAPLPGLETGPRPPRWLVAAPLPPAARAHGRLVPGFPRDVLPTPRWARVRSSSVSAQGRTLQVTLAAGFGRSRAALVEHYRAVLLGLGFAASPSSSLGGGDAVTFSRRRDTVALSLDPDRPTYTLFAVLHAGPRL